MTLFWVTLVHHRVYWIAMKDIIVATLSHANTID